MGAHLAHALAVDDIDITWQQHSTECAPHAHTPTAPTYLPYSYKGCQVIDGKTFGQVFLGLSFFCALIAPWGLHFDCRGGGLLLGG